MTEISRPWAGTVTGDAGPYTAPHWWDVWQSMIGSSGALTGAGNAGVFPWVPGKLAVTYVAPNFVSVAAGAAMIDGLFYNNSASISVTVTSATAGKVRDDRLVIRKYFSGLIQTARLTLVAGSEVASPGPGTPPALVQDTTRQTYWDLPLARVSVTDGGAITLTDERVLAGASNFQVANPMYGYDVVGAVNYYQTDSVGIVLLGSGASNVVAGYVRIPDYVTYAYGRFLGIYTGGAASGNVCITTLINGGAAGSLFPHSYSHATFAAPMVKNTITRLESIDLLAAGFTAGDLMRFWIARYPADPLDTLSGTDIYYMGAELECR